MDTIPTNDTGVTVKPRSKAAKRDAEYVKAQQNLKLFVDLIDIPGVPSAAADPLKPRFGKHHLHWLKCGSGPSISRRITFRRSSALRPLPAGR